MQFCMDFFLERINLASFFGKSVNNERRLMFVFIIFCNHLVYANIFAAITNYNQLVCLSKILSDFLEQFPKELIISLRLYLTLLVSQYELAMPVELRRAHQENDRAVMVRHSHYAWRKSHIAKNLSYTS